MTNLKVFNLKADGELEEVDLAKARKVMPSLVHPHTFEHFTQGKPCLFAGDGLKAIADIVLRKGVEADIVHVGIGDPLSCREGEAIPQEVHIAPKGQRALRV